MMNNQTLSILLAGIASTALSQAELSTPTFFSDGMVLQRETNASIWGHSDPESTVSVSFKDHNLTTQADKDGSWKVTFKGLSASKSGKQLIISSGSDTKTIENVLVGEVWIASGQSNMEWTMSKSLGVETANTAVDPLLRVYTASNVSAETPAIDFVGTWKSTKPGNTGGFTATGWEFAKRLRDELDVPVGILETAWGGKSVEAYTSAEALQALPEAKIVLDRKATSISKWNPEAAQKRYEKLRAEHKVKLAEFKKAADPTKRAPKPPRAPENPSSGPSMHSNIYNGMISPLIGYGIRGGIWYQGENNSNTGTSEIYEELLTCMIKDWRSRWNHDFSFYFVQLANFKKPTTAPGLESPWVNVQDEMRKTVGNLEKTGIAIINDIGMADDIHPPNKHDVGDRLARWALAKDYGKSGFSVSGPLYSSHQIKGNKFIIQLDHAKGLKSRDGKDIARLEITDGNGTWKWATGKINGTSIEVWNDAISKPTRVRYAWASNPSGANLVNAEGLPASCFDTAAQ